MMRSLRRALAAGAPALLAAFALAWSAAAAEGEVAVPKLTGHVIDQTATLDRAQAAALEADLADFERARGSQVVVLLVPTTGTETIEDFAGRVTDAWQLDGDGDDYDLWVLGPAGFHRHITGRATPHAAAPEVDVAYVRGDLEIAMHNRGVEPIELVLRANAYTAEEHHVVVPAGQDRVRRWSLERSAHWYDLTVEARGLPGFRRRFAGRVETGRDSLSDPAMGGPARGEPG